jgi:hypothetical protein
MFKEVSIMTDVETHSVKKTLDYLSKKLSNDKGKNFIFHLIRAILPINLDLIKEEVPEGTRCCVTGIQLKKGIELEVKKIKVDPVYLEVDSGSGCDINYIKKVDELKSRVPIEVPNLSTVLYSKTSDKLMSVEGALILNKFIMQEVLNGNPDIIYIVNQIVGGGHKNKEVQKGNKYDSTVQLGEVYNISINKINRK